MDPKRIIISVSYKYGIEKWGKLLDRGYEIISTGGTFNQLRAAGIACTSVEEVTGFPEMMDGRLKTLHPKIMGGILADRSKPEHLKSMEENGIKPIDVVVVNLYPFDQAPGIGLIDVGGPSMLRAAAKNHKFVLPVIDPDDYDAVIEFISNNVDDQYFRAQLAHKVFARTAQYDALIAAWFKQEFLAEKTAIE